MDELWGWYLIIGGAIIFTFNVVFAAVQLSKYANKGKNIAEEHFNNRVRNVIIEDRAKNCPWVLNYTKEVDGRKANDESLKSMFREELRPIKENISAIMELNIKLHHSQMTDLQIKLNSLFHDKFDKKGVFTKVEQSNWDRWYSDYTALGGNSDIAKMDDLIQKARIHAALEKASQQSLKKEGETNEVESD